MKLIFTILIIYKGTEYVWTKSRMWRKNRRPESNGVVYGVDNNRNYDLDWEKCGGSSSPSSETYKFVEFTNWKN